MVTYEKMQSSPELNNEKLHDKFSGLFWRAFAMKGIGPVNYEDNKNYHELKANIKRSDGNANWWNTIMMNREIIIEDKIKDKKTGEVNINQYSLYMHYVKTLKGVSIEWKYNDKYLTSVEGLDKAFNIINDVLVKMEAENFREKNRKDLKDLSYEITNTVNQGNEPDYA